MKTKHCIPWLTAAAVISIAVLTYPWIFSAGGLGSIRKYEFNYSRAAIINKFDSLILNDPNIGVPSKLIYNLDSTGYEADSKYIYILSNAGDTMVFSYEYYNYSDSSFTSIALTHYGKSGWPSLKTSRNIFFFQKKSKAKDFEQILQRLNLPFIKEP